MSSLPVWLNVENQKGKLFLNHISQRIRFYPMRKNVTTMSLIIKRSGWFLFALVIAASSCKVPRVAQVKPLEAVPAQYPDISSRDSAALGNVPRALFFSDPDLQRIITDVLQYNPEIRMALERINMAGASLRQSRGALLPGISALARASGTRYGKYTMEGVGNFDTNLSGNIEDDQRVNTNITPDFWLGLAASWELDLWGKLRQQKKAAAHRFWATKAAHQWVVSMLVSQTATAYYELVALDKEAGILKEHLAIQERALEIVKMQKEAGRATSLAILQFEAQLLETKSAQRANQRQQELLIHLLNRLRGKYEGSVERSAAWPSMVAEGSLQPGVPATMLATRPDVQEAALQLNAAHADAKAARAAFFPNITLSAYTAFNAFNPNLVFSLSSIGAQMLGGLTAPIFQGHQIRGRFAIAHAEQEQAFQQYRDRALTAYNEVVDELRKLAYGREIQDLKLQQVAALSEGVEVANELYLNGYADYLEIITAQKSKIATQLELINTQREMALSVIALYRASGGGWQ
jgi:multidrug efflux system outer membrane protein